MLHYLVKEPTITQTANKAIILLHGYGSNEQDLFSFAPYLPKDHYIFSLQAPYDLGYGSYAWYAIHFDADENKFSDIAQATSSRDLLLNQIASLTEKYSLDPNEITLMGFSQGAILSYALALSYPQKIKQIVALSGYINTEILTANYKQNDFSSLRIFASHGSQDQVIPISWARKTPDLLNQWHITHHYKEYPVGHTVAPENFWDAVAWLET